MPLSGWAMSCATSKADACLANPAPPGGFRPRPWRPQPAGFAASARPQLTGRRCAARLTHVTPAIGYRIRRESVTPQELWWSRRMHRKLSAMGSAAKGGGFRGPAGGSDRPEIRAVPRPGRSDAPRGEYPGARRLRGGKAVGYRSITSTKQQNKMVRGDKASSLIRRDAHEWGLRAMLKRAKAGAAAGPVTIQLRTEAMR